MSPVAVSASRAVGDSIADADAPVRISVRGLNFYYGDFRGLKGTSFDGRGNYATGLKEHIVFPEINYDQIDQMWGMDIIVCTTAKTDEEAKALLTEFKFPFVN